MEPNKAKYETVQIKDVLDLIKRFTVSVRPDPSIVWRGQSSSEWGLTPSLFRSEIETEDGSISTEKLIGD